MLSKKFIFIFFLIFVISIPFIYNYYEISEILFVNFKYHSQVVFNITDSYPFASSLIFFLIVAFSVVINIPGSSIKAILAGIFFGWHQGAIMMILSITIGSYISIKFYGFFFKIMFQKNKIHKLSKRINLDINNPSFILLVFLRLATVIPLIIQNMIISTLRIKKIPLLLSTLIGVSPILIIYTYIGNFFSTVILNSQSKLDVWNLINDKIIYSFLVLGLFAIILSIISIKVKNLIYKNT